MATAEPYNVGMTNQIIVRLTVPEELDPLNVLWTMADEFFYANRHSEDIGPHMDNIRFEVVKEVQA